MPFGPKSSANASAIATRPCVACEVASLREIVSRARSIRVNCLSVELRGFAGSSSGDRRIRRVRSTHHPEGIREKIRPAGRPCERRDPSPLASKVNKNLCSSAEPRVRGAAMSAIALTLGSLHSQGGLVETPRVGNFTYDSPAWSGGPYRVKEFAYLELEATAVAGQRFCRGENLRRSRSGFAGTALHIGDVG
jgi:hypothetical protein